MKTYQIIETQELGPLVALWQKVLRLQDWDITALIVPEIDIPPDRRGEIEYEAKLCQAFMRILHPSGYAAGMEVDMEQVLVHELQHLKMAFTDEFILKNPLMDVYLEFAVDSNARALVGLARQNAVDFYSNLELPKSVGMAGTLAGHAMLKSE